MWSDWQKGYKKSRRRGIMSRSIETLPLVYDSCFFTGRNPVSCPRVTFFWCTNTLSAYTLPAQAAHSLLSYGFPDFSHHMKTLTKLVHWQLTKKLYLQVVYSVRTSETYKWRLTYPTRRQLVRKPTCRHVC